MGGRMLKGLAVVVLAAAVGSAIMVHASNVPADAEYVGTGKCRMCHMEEHKTWSDTKHAKAWDSLVGPEVNDPDCVKCHVTGYGEPGGFKDAESTPKMVNVGCEDCHGPGSAHLAAASKNLGKSEGWEKQINKVPENTCVNCHNPHIDFGEQAEKLRAERGQ